jgi:hypothetical protein
MDRLTNRQSENNIGVGGPYSITGTYNIANLTTILETHRVTYTFVISKINEEQLSSCRF